MLDSHDIRRCFPRAATKRLPYWAGLGGDGTSCRFVLGMCQDNGFCSFLCMLPTHDTDLILLFPLLYSPCPSHSKVSRRHDRRNLLLFFFFFLTCQDVYPSLSLHISTLEIFAPPSLPPPQLCSSPMREMMDQVHPPPIGSKQPVCPSSPLPPSDVRFHSEMHNRKGPHLSTSSSPPAIGSVRTSLEPN